MSRDTTKSSRAADSLPTLSDDARLLRASLGTTLGRVYGRYPRWTVAQYLVALEAWIAQDDDQPHTVISLARKLGMPYSTASRVIWTLTTKAGGSVLRLESHPRDRRKKYVVVNSELYDTLSCEPSRPAATRNDPV